MLGYAYILTHPGIPCLFWEHNFGGWSACYAAVASRGAICIPACLFADRMLE